MLGCVTNVGPFAIHKLILAMTWDTNAKVDTKKSDQNGNAETCCSLRFSLVLDCPDQTTSKY